MTRERGDEAREFVEWWSKAHVSALPKEAVRLWLHETRGADERAVEPAMPDPLTGETLDELEALLAKLPTGEWFPVDYIEDTGDYSPPRDHYCVGVYEDDPTDAICWIDESRDPRVQEVIRDLIPMLHNRAPSLIAAARRRLEEEESDD